MANKENLILGASLGTQIGGPGTWISGGFITHEEYNQKLLWRRGIDLFDMMRRSDPSIQALLKVCKMPLGAATYDIEAASDEEFDQYAMRFVKNELFDRNIKWPQFIHDGLGKLEFGFSLFEKTYGTTEFEKQVRIGIDDLGWRKQWSILRWETEDHQPGVSQQLMTKVVGIPQDKLLLFSNDREGDNYQGISLLRYVYKDWDIKHRVENLMAVAAERSLGVPAFEHKAGLSEKAKTQIEEILTNFRANEKGYLMYEMGMGTLTFPQIKTNITQDYIPILEYLQHEIDKSILAQFLDLAGSRSGGSSGSHALAADQSQMFEKALESVIKEMVDTINTDLIQQLCDLNFSDMPNGYPKLTFGNIGDENLDQKGKFMEQLASVGLLTPDADMENVVREWADLPDLPDDIYDDYENRQLPGVPGAAAGVVLPVDSSTPTVDKNGKTLQNPTEKMPGKPAQDQGNAVTRTNAKKNDANKPTPESTVKAAEQARKNLIAAVMEA